nr:HipA domain-containing protein [Rhizobium leguminosarum]
MIGNGDMHLKNWSRIYPETRRPVLPRLRPAINDPIYRGEIRPT